MPDSLDARTEQRHPRDGRSGEPDSASAAETSGQRTDRTNRNIGVLCAIAVVILFSGFTLMSRLAFASSLKLMDVAALRFSIGGLLLLPVLWHHRLAGIRWRDAGALAFLGGLGFALLAYAGFSLAPASHGAVLLHGTLPLLSFALVRVATKTKATRGQAIGLATIFIGIAAMAWDSLRAANGRSLLGDGCLLLASACWSAYGVRVHRLRLNPAHAASIVAVFSMCVAMPVYLLMPGKALFLASAHELLLQGIFQGVLIGAVSIFVYTRAVASLGAVETALFTTAVPCVTTVGAVFLLAERPSLIAMLGVVIVTVGMGISLKLSHRPKATDCP